MPRLTLRKVNAFTVGGVAATGNPAAVCLLSAPLLGCMTDNLRQRIAKDIGLSETAFIEPTDPAASPTEDAFKQQDTFKLRWFTPASEVPLCGHATLASAATLFTACSNPSPTLHFQTLSGTLSVTRKQQGHQTLLQMSLPLSSAVDPLPQQLLAHTDAAVTSSSSSSSSNGSSLPLPELLARSPSLCRLLHACTCTSTTPTATAPGTSPAATSSSAGRNSDDHQLLAQQLAERVQHVGFVSALQYLLVVLQPGQTEGRQAVEAVHPDPVVLEAAASSEYLSGVIVTAAASLGDHGGYDFYSRFFGPWLGIFEDPVTGSAHAVLAPYWSAVLGKQQLYARQCSSRGGDVWMEVAEHKRVLVSGEAVIQETWEKHYP